MTTTTTTPRVLLVECTDRPGLVHGITGALFRAGLNVTANQEFVDAETARFFMRTEFTGGNAPADDPALLAAVRTELPVDPDATRVRLADGLHRPRIVVFATREGHCLGDLLIRHALDELPAEIVGVLANRDVLRALVERFGVPFHHLPADPDDPREVHEAAINAQLDALRPDLLVLARYMRVLSPGFVARWPSAIVNIHHSFLPAFAGARPYHQAFQRGVKVIGATAHFVTDVLDEGPILAQGVVPVDHRLDARALAQAGRDVEQTTLARALRLVLENRVFLCGNRTIIFD